MTPPRRPAVAGAFYEEQPAALRAQVAACFPHPLGPGRVPAMAPRRAGRVRALVVPHAGLAYSGPVAAHAYAALAEDGWPDSFLLVGPNHTGLGGLGALSARDWQTPLGLARCDTDLVRALGRGVLEVDEAAHAEEHSLEVQLPFLRWLAEGAGSEVRFAAVVMGLQDEDTARGVGEEVARAARDRDVVLIASSDLMHAGPDYAVPVPRGGSVGDFVRAQDEHALRCIAALEPAKLLDQVRFRDVSMCGAGPVAAVIHAARLLGATRATQLAHHTSHDIRAHRSAVGYASFVLG